MIGFTIAISASMICISIAINRSYIVEAIDRFTKAVERKNNAERN